jgi:glycosyltransferase involved in cell wall biosynthesis
MPPPNPKITIGLPVYNGERYLSEAIESLLNQTYTNFEIIVCDNASTDDTEKLGKYYAELDQRIRYYRNIKNIGAAGNFNLTFELARGEYFKWAAHDDLIGKDYLMKCVESLDRDSSVVLCHTEAQYIDEHGNNIQNPPAFIPDASSTRPNIRFAHVINMRHWCLDIFGLIRRDALAQTPLISDYVGSDRNTLATLALIGRFDRVSERIFFTRDHSERSVRKIPLHRRAGWFNPRKNHCISFPHWRVFTEYIKSVWGVRIPVREKISCVWHLINWLSQNRGVLKKDCRLGLKQLFINKGIDDSKYRFWKGKLL